MQWEWEGLEMYCTACGGQVNDNAKFCPKCGHPFSAAKAPSAVVQPMSPKESSSSFGSATYGSPNHSSAYYDTATAYPVAGTLYERKLEQAAREGLAMNWYKFIIYVQCFIGGISGLATGVSQIFGFGYGDSASLIYHSFPVLKFIDVAYGIVCIVVGVLFIYTRFGLKQFKASAVGIYLFLPLINAASALVYGLLALIVLHSSLLGSELISISFVGTIGASVAFFVTNYIYFNKRRHLFCEV